MPRPQHERDDRKRQHDEPREEQTPRKLKGSILVVSIIILILYIFFIVPWFLTWGATDEEVAMTLPGDDIVPAPQSFSTRAIEIEAAPSRIWPWLVQIGVGRGGFYSYEALENLVGCNITNVTRIVPRYQELREGDVILLHPKGLGYVVVMLENERTFLMQSADTATRTLYSNTANKGNAYSIWGFHLQETDEGTTRLIARSHVCYTEGVLNHILWRWFMEPVNFIMEQKMLREIKRLAERGTRDA